MKVYKLASVLTQQVPPPDGASFEYIGVIVNTYAPEFSINSERSLNEDEFTEEERAILDAAVDLIKTKLLE